MQHKNTKGYRLTCMGEIGDSGGTGGETGGSSKLGSAFSSLTAGAPLRVS